jgi:hypothetical protein
MFVHYCSNMYSCESIFMFDVVLPIYLTKNYGFLCLIMNNENQPKFKLSITMWAKFHFVFV